MQQSKTEGEASHGGRRGSGSKKWAIANEMDRWRAGDRSQAIWRKRGDLHGGCRQAGDAYGSTKRKKELKHQLSYYTM